MKNQAQDILTLLEFVLHIPGKHWAYFLVLVSMGSVLLPYYAPSGVLLILAGIGVLILGYVEVYQAGKRTARRITR